MSLSPSLHLTTIIRDPLLPSRMCDIHLSLPVQHPPRHLPRHAESPSLLSHVLPPAAPCRRHAAAWRVQLVELASKRKTTHTIQCGSTVCRSSFRASRSPHSQRFTHFSSFYQSCVSFSAPCRLLFAFCFHLSSPVEHPPRHLPRHADHPVLCSSMLSPAVPRPRQIPAKPRFSRNPGCGSFPLGALLFRAKEYFVKAWWIMP